MTLWRHTFCRSPRSPVTWLLALLVLGLISYWVGVLHFPDRSPRNVPNNDHQVVSFQAKQFTEQNNFSHLACVFPNLELHDFEIMKFFKVLPRVQCDLDPDWVTIRGGLFIIQDSAIEQHGAITCNAYPIVKVTDFKTTEAAVITNIKNSTQISNDFYRVTCTAEDNSTYNNYHAGIRLDKTVHSRAIKPRGLDLDVVMIGLDSTSRLAWQRHLPKTRDYFLNVLHGLELQGYNILGDGTPAAIMPILIGNREEELHEARRGHAGAQTVDDFPWIWNEFRDAGYALAWGEDDASLGTFQYRLLGFHNQPTDHYFRYFSLAIGPYYRDYKPDCLRARPRHVLLFDYMRQMYEVYPNRRKWIFSFMSELSHKDNNLLSRMDDDLLEHVQEMYTRGYLDNALLIMMADHGGRFSKVRATAQGKQEERLPYFALRFPQWFHEKYPDIIQNIRINAKRLTTPFDIHETLHELLNFTGTGTANINNRGVSLFKKIPKERNCDLAHIDPHWCACLDWKEKDVNDDTIKKVMNVIISTFNSFIDPYRDRCAHLSIDKVVSASSLKVNDAVLKFKDTSDGGRGRFGKMTDTTQHSKILYQVAFLTHPGGGRFEVTVSHNVKKNTFTLDPKDISRTNMYGKAPHCVEKEDPFVRPFCYCKDLR